jgi:uncharacterized membrane protein YoaK (UPF0700 family)
MKERKHMDSSDKEILIVFEVMWLIMVVGLIVGFAILEQPVGVIISCAIFLTFLVLILVSHIHIKLDEIRDDLDEKFFNLKKALILMKKPAKKRTR